jgi:hypothetical protein
VLIQKNLKKEQMVSIYKVIIISKQTKIQANICNMNNNNPITTQLKKNQPMSYHLVSILLMNLTNFPTTKKNNMTVTNRNIL